MKGWQAEYKVKLVQMVDEIEEVLRKFVLSEKKAGEI